LSYEEALKFLDRYIDYEKLPDYRYTQAAFRLDRMTELLCLLGDPQKDFKSVHIAGTKGKGSTATMIAALLENHGFRTGLYTSPHIVSIRERVRIGSEMIGCADFARAVSAMRSKIERVEKLMIPVTYFEILTALAFLEFSRKKVQIASVEVGIGGRLDATNVITPEVCCITNISYDHMDKLGNTLTQIATEKCGIIKPKIPIISAPQKTEALRVIRRFSREKNVPLFLVGQDIQIGKSKTLAETRCRKYPAPRTLPDYLRYCAHAWEDAAVALGALEILAEKVGFDIDPRACQEAFANLKIEGRFEVKRGEPTLILDGAHNAASARSLAKSLRVFARENRLREREFIFLISMAKDKDISGFLREVVPVAKEIIFTTSPNPRCADPRQLKRTMSRISPVSSDSEPDISCAFERAKENAGKSGVLVVTGSFYLLGEITKAISYRLEERMN
jgi:dihydrofolate synthase/folylpolyglutamate synthase